MKRSLLSAPACLGGLVLGLMLGLAVAAIPAQAQNAQMIDQVFGQLDANRDGQLSAEELRSMADGDPNKDARVGMLIVMLDADGDSQLSKEEFAAMMAGGGAITEEQARRLFDHFDMDASGAIDHLEGRTVMGQMQSGMTEAQMDEALMKADSNGDGEIDFPEFRKVGG